MAVVIRFSRQGAKSKPFYRVVAADKQYPLSGRYLEVLGTYNPKTKSSQLDAERIQYWLGQGAIASQTVSRLLKKTESVKATASAKV